MWKKIVIYSFTKYFNILYKAEIMQGTFSENPENVRNNNKKLKKQRKPAKILNIREFTIILLNKFRPRRNKN